MVIGPGWWKRWPSVVAPLVDARDLDRHDLLAEQGNDRMERAHPAQVAVAPAHRLGPGEVGDDPADRLGNDLGRRAGPAARSARTRCRRDPRAGPGSARSCAGSLRAPAAARWCAGPSLPRSPPRSRRQRRARSAPAAAGSKRSRSRHGRAPPRRSASANIRGRSLRALACIRAGISSDSSSSRKSAIRRLPRCARSTPRTPPWRGRGRGRYRPGARRR